jgi:hypothetical protein
MWGAWGVVSTAPVRSQGGSELAFRAHATVGAFAVTVLQLVRSTCMSRAHGQAVERDVMGVLEAAGEGVQVGRGIQPSRTALL